MTEEHVVSVILMECYHVPGMGSWLDPRVVDAVRWAQKEHGVIVICDEVFTGGGRRAQPNPPPLPLSPPSSPPVPAVDVRCSQSRV